jgi:hypothetical protein
MIPSSVSGYIQSNLTSLIDNLLNNKPPRKPHKNFCWLYSSRSLVWEPWKFMGCTKYLFRLLPLNYVQLFVARIAFKITVV